MTAHVLIPFDGSPAATNAIDYAQERFSDVSFTLLYVMDPMMDYSRRRSFPGYREDDGFKNEREKGEALLETGRRAVTEDVPVETELVAGNPARAILSFADDNDVDQIVLGSHGRTGVARFLLGSVAETVVRRAAIPVTVVRPSE